MGRDEHFEKTRDQLIAALRQMTRLRRAEVAAQLGTTVSDVSHKLTDTRNITLKTMCDLIWAAGYKVNIHIKRDLERP